MINLERFIVVRQGCPFCLMAIKAVLFLNRYLPDDSKISIIDNYEREEFGFISHPFVELMLDSETFDGYPYLYIDGCVIEPAPSELLIISIAKIISDDLLTQLNFNGRIISPSQKLY